MLDQLSCIATVQSPQILNLLNSTIVASNSSTQAFLEHIDILVFVEATIYQMDEENEILAKTGDIAEGHQLRGACHTLRSSAAAKAWR